MNFTLHNMKHRECQKKNDSASSQKTEFYLVAHTATQLSCLGHISMKQNIKESK